MGQYWTMKNLDKNEMLSTHAFGRGLKYMEQWFSGTLFSALMVLLTDFSSLGHGGGDFRLSDAPQELKVFILPMMGSWAGDRIVFSGDYTETEEYVETDDDGEDVFTDISDRTALAIWSMVACDCIKSTEDQNAKTVKDAIVTFFEQVRGYKSWEQDQNLKTVLATLDGILSGPLELDDQHIAKKARS